MTAIWAEQALLAEGWARDVTLTLENERIGGIQTDSLPQNGAQRVGILLAAPTNLHSHSFQRAMAGLAERRSPNLRDTFWTWRQVMFRFLDQLTPDDIETIAAFAQMQMLQAGYAAVVEFHYLHHAPNGTPYGRLAETSERIVAAARRTGIGLTLLPVLYEYGGCDQRSLGPGQVRFGNGPDRFARLLEEAEAAVANLFPDARLGVAAHSLRAVSPEGLAVCIELVPEAPFHMHLAEQEGEVDEVLAHLGARPAQWLLANAPVDARWCLIHCTQLQRNETLALAGTGAVVGLCPITEASLGDGIFDAVAWVGAGGRWGVGSDSNIRISLVEELRTLEYTQRLRDRGRALLATSERSTGRTLLESSARGGAQAAGRDGGVIASGRLADLVAIDANHVDLAGRQGDAALDGYVFAADDGLVTDVWAAGRHMVIGGTHIDYAGISAAYRATLASLSRV